MYLICPHCHKKVAYYFTRRNSGSRLCEHKHNGKNCAGSRMPTSKIAAKQ
jgi:hypothetical protein